MKLAEPPPILADRDLEDVAAEIALVTREATWRRAGQVALALARNAREVQYWGEPQQFRPGPLYAAWCLLRALFKAQPDEDRRLRPLHYLCEQAGGRFVLDEDAAAPTLASLDARLMQCMGSFGRWIDVVAKAVENNHITDREIDELRRHLREHMTALNRADDQLVRIHQERRRIT